MPNHLNRLYLTDIQLTAIMQHVSANIPLEVCGLLSGAGGIVQKVYPVPNIAPHPEVSFQMEPKAQVRAMMEIDLQGLELVAIYHSHPPGSRTDPSEADLRQASYPGVYLLIVVPSHEPGATSIRAFTTTAKRAVEVPVVIN